MRNDQPHHPELNDLRDVAHFMTALAAVQLEADHSVDLGRPNGFDRTRTPGFPPGYSEALALFPAIAPAFHEAVKRKRSGTPDPHDADIIARGAAALQALGLAMLNGSRVLLSEALYGEG